MGCFGAAIAWFFISLILGYVLAGSSDAGSTISIIIFLGGPIIYAIFSSISKKNDPKDQQTINIQKAEINLNSINFNPDSSFIDKEIDSDIRKKFSQKGNLKKLLFEKQKAIEKIKKEHLKKSILIYGIFDKQYLTEIKNIQDEIEKLKIEENEIIYNLAQPNINDFEKFKLAYGKWTKSNNFKEINYTIMSTPNNEFFKDLILCNIIPLIINLQNSLFFLIYSTVIIVFNGKNDFVAALSISSMYITTKTEYHEMNHNYPADSKILDEEWLYQRKDGKPDLRYNNNYKIYTMEFSKTSISIAGFSIIILTSSYEKSIYMKNSFDLFKKTVYQTIDNKYNDKDKFNDEEIIEFDNDSKSDTDLNIKIKSNLQQKIDDTKVRYKNCDNINQIIKKYTNSVSKEMLYNTIELGILKFYLGHYCTFTKNKSWSIEDIKKLIKDYLENDTYQEDFATYELEVSQKESRYSSFSIQKLNSPYSKFIEMRNLIRQKETDYYISYSYYDAEIFKQQAHFMVSFEDYYDNDVTFQQYLPTYMSMNDKQLRTYFTWRTKIRKGIVNKTSSSYVYVYIYELLNNVGAENKFDAVSKLVFIWKEYLKHDDQLNIYLPIWLKDYYICNDFDITFEKYSERFDIQQYYPEVFLSNESPEYTLERYNKISNYKIKNSRFYSEDKKDLINDCLNAVFESVSAFFHNYEFNFDLFVFGQTEKYNWWKPFSNAIYAEAESKKSRQVHIGKNEIYVFENGEWSCTKPPNYNYGAASVVGYILKRAEAKMRIITNFKYKLSPNIKTVITSLSYSTLDNSKLFKIILNPEFDIIIDNSVENFFIYNKPDLIVNRAIINTTKDLKIDTSKLDKIRTDSLIIQDKLIISDNEIVEKESTAVILKPDINVGSNSNGTEISIGVDSGNIWEDFYNSLTLNQQKAIYIISNGCDVTNKLQEISNESGTFIEVIFESINELALDYIGDNIIETSGVPVYIYEDYIDEFNQIIRRD